LHFEGVTLCHVGLSEISLNCTSHYCIILTKCSHHASYQKKVFFLIHLKSKEKISAISTHFPPQNQEHLVEIVQYTQLLQIFICILLHLYFLTIIATTLITARLEKKHRQSVTKLPNDCAKSHNCQSTCKGNLPLPPCFVSYIPSLPFASYFPPGQASGSIIDAKIQTLSYLD